MYRIVYQSAHTGKLLLQQTRCVFRSMELSLCSLRLQTISLYLEVSANVEIDLDVKFQQWLSKDMLFSADAERCQFNERDQGAGW
ncbi:hypothetical protein [Bordetella bronchiseptica]|uniref:hypothetical protein n=1 Tax=Bordetella bronchiseptica TaxID=518 RepID=UPI001F1CD0CB|nr:hypothetical protein [Bordetella bronchiseptica]